TVVHHIVKVGGEIGKQLVQPLIALVEGRLHGGEGEGVVPVDIHVHPELVKDLLFVRVGEHHCAGLQAGQVEGLGARDAGDDVGGDLGGQGGSGDVLFAVEDQVGVDLVGDHQHVMLQAQFHHPAQLLFRPDMAQGVVGGA
ncbi:Ferric uptake regulation protein, partial [Dysosmobacter welbionis]